MIEINKKIEACLMISSYLETVGFKNGNWEFNFGEKIDSINMYINTWTYLLNEYFILGGSSIDITGWNASDDTILMIATARSVIDDGKEENYKKYYINYSDELMKDKRFTGINTKNILLLLNKGYSIKTLEINSKMGGNGAAIRTSPIGIKWYKNIDKVIEESLIASKLTHNYYLGFLGGMITALFTAFAMNNIKPWKWCDELIKLYDNKIIEKYYIKDKRHDLNDLDYYIGFWKKYKETRISKLEYKNTSDNFISPSARIKFILGFSSKSVTEQLNNGIGLNQLKIKWDAIGSSGLDSCIYAYDCLLLSMNTPGSRKLDFNNINYSWDSFMALVAIHPGDNDSTAAIGGAWYGALLGYQGIDLNRMKQLEFYKELKEVSDKIINSIK